MNSLIPVRGKPVLRNIIPLLISVIASAVFVLFFSYSGSLLHENLGLDQGIWCIIGRGILHGYIPYLDLYDHKGPLLFYIFSVAMAISEGKTGLFLIEVLFTSISVFTIHKMTKLFVSNRWSWTSVTLYLLWSFATIYYGTTNEVLSQPFCLVPLYCVLRYYQKGGITDKLPFWICVLIGAGGGAVTMIRMNNAALLFGCAIVVLLLRWKEVSFRAMLSSFSQMLIGFVALILPFVLYFWHCGAMEYFLQGLLFHNIGYVAHTGKEALFIIKCLVRGAFVLLLISLLIREWRNGETDGRVCWIIALSSILSVLVQQMGPGYVSYFYSYSPALIFTFCYIVRYGNSFFCYFLTRHKKLLPIVFTVIFVFPFCVAPAIGWYKTIHDMRAHSHNSQELPVCKLVQSIPVEERGQIMSWEIWPQQLYQTKIIPCYRYFVLQDFHSSHLPKIGAEIRHKLTTDPPLYIIARENAITEPLSSCLKENYEELARAGEGPASCILYKRKAD